MDDLMLVARIAGERIALPAAPIESVVEIGRMTPVPLAAAHVAGLAALRSRVLTVIDSYAALGLATPPATPDRQAVVVSIDGHSYGLLVDEVEDVVAVEGDPAPLRAGLAPGWAEAALGLVDIGDKAVLLLDPSRLVAGRPAG